MNFCILTHLPNNSYTIKFYILFLQPMNVLNNYFSVGIDAHIALQFHRARNNNPEHFKSRTRNLLYYGLEGGKDLFKQQWRNLMDYVTIECDGVDYTHRLKAYGTHSVLFLNIKSYAGGTRPWNNKSKGFGVQDMNDGLLEVCFPQYKIYRDLNRYSNRYFKQWYPS